MTNFIRTIIASLLLIAGSQSVLGQTFSSMDETQRQTKLTKIALTIYKNPKFSKYYSKYGYYGRSEISTYNIKGEGEDKDRKEYLGTQQYTPIRDKIAISCMLREIHEFSSHAIRHGLYIKNRKRLFCP